MGQRDSSAIGTLAFVTKGEDVNGSRRLAIEATM
jgi:hypothetical protein